MKEKVITDKAQYLKNNYPFDEIPKLTDLKRCIHCGNIFIVKDYKVFVEDGEEYIYCPNAPECDGTVIDWFPVTDA